MKKIIILLIIFVLSAQTWSQHRGDNLAFQGMQNQNRNGVKAAAMGGAFTGRVGDISSMYYNPAGLTGIQGLQISIAAAQTNRLWQENQDYRPNRFEITLPFYLEGLYIPDPNNNGMWDYDIFESERNSSYFVSDPILGKDRYSEDVADWQEKRSELVFDNIAIAYPFNVAGRSLVVAASFNRKVDVQDYDHNDTWLSPHIGYDFYGEMPRATTDTLTMQWYTFDRSRSGYLDNISAAVSFDITKNLTLGAGLNRISGETDDKQYLDKVGWFDIAKNNRFRFSYDTLKTNTTGTSKFSAMNADVGLMFRFSRVNVGVALTTPYTIERQYNYTQSERTAMSVNSTQYSGTDEMNVPLAWRLGVVINPVDKFKVALDYESTPYSNAEFVFARTDTSHREWVDRNSLRFGIEYSPISWIDVMAGYKYVYQPFVPDGAAFHDRGPQSESYTAGISIYALKGRFDIAYEMWELKYYDSYYSNTNFALETRDYFMFGYTLQL